MADDPNMVSAPLPAVGSIDPTLDLFEEVDRLRTERKAVTLAHYYQDPNIDRSVSKSPCSERSLSHLCPQRSPHIRRHNHGRFWPSLTANGRRSVGATGCHESSLPRRATRKVKA